MSNIRDEIQPRTMQPIANPRTEQSEKIARDVQEFLKRGGEIHTYWAGDANFKSDIEKANSQKVRHLKHKKQGKIINLDKAIAEVLLEELSK